MFFSRDKDPDFQFERLVCYYVNIFGLLYYASFKSFYFCGTQKKGGERSQESLLKYLGKNFVKNTLDCIIIVLLLFK